MTIQDDEGRIPLLMTTKIEIGRLLPVYMGKKVF